MVKNNNNRRNRKNLSLLYNQINEDIEMIDEDLQQYNSLNKSPSSVNLLNKSKSNAKLDDKFTNKPQSLFIKKSASMNSLNNNMDDKILDIIIQKDILDALLHNNNNISNNKNKLMLEDKKLKTNKKKKNISKQQLDNIEFNMESKLNEIPDYCMINSAFKVYGESLLNEEIDNKYKSKIKQHPENIKVIQKLKENFKKLVVSEVKSSPNICQIIMDETLTEELKIKLIKRYLRMGAEEETFSPEADKTKIEINNLIKYKDIKIGNNYEELEKQVFSKVLPTKRLEDRLREMYFRILEGDQHKLINYVNNVIRLPYDSKPNIIEKYMSNEIEHEKKVEFIKSLYDKLNQELYGMESAKDSIISFICQKLNNPNSESSKYLCLCGDPGVGKTSIITTIAKFLEIPYAYNSLANIEEPTSLIGHSYTYEGSIYGSIAASLINNGCSNGIILFDEVDKCKEKVQTTMLGVFDPLQNATFRDAYFGDFYIDLSKTTMILSLNDLDKINPILRDRLHIVKIDGYNSKEKLEIINKFTIPKLEKEYNIQVEIDSKVIDKIIEETSEHKGIRQCQLYLTKIYELMVLDKYTNKYNFNNKFGLKDIEHLHFNKKNDFLKSMYI